MAHVQLGHCGCMSACMCVCMCGRQTTIDVDVLMYGVIIYRQYRLLMKILTDSYKLCTLNHQFDVI